MNQIIKQLSSMYKNELYSNVVRLCELSTTICEQKPDSGTPSTKLQLFTFHADSLYNLHEYVRAEAIYRQLLQLQKHLKTKNVNKEQQIEPPILSEVDAKFMVAQCCMKQKQKQRAREVLESVPARSRTGKINMILGSLLWESGCERSAIGCFKEVLKEEPLALEAAENLLKLGVSGVEVSELMLKGMGESSASWINMWMIGLAQLHSRDTRNAITSFKNLDTVGLLKDNCSLLVNLGHCYTLLCNEEQAINYLQRAVRLDPSINNGRDLLATLLSHSFDKEHHNFLEKMLTPMVDMTLWSIEQWIVLGCYMYVNKKYDKAAYFGQQACFMNRRNVEALILKGKTLMQLGKFSDAAVHFLEAQSFAPFRFDIYKHIVECYMRTNRLREAEATANNACVQLDHNTHALTLKASVMMKDPMPNIKISKRLLEKAIALDPTNFKAVFLMVELLNREQLFEDSVKLLRRHLEANPVSHVHQLLGDNLARIHHDDEAFDHYTIALRLDPNNQRAIEGLNNLSDSLSTSKRDSFYTAREESPTFACQAANDREPDAESDSEMWSNGNNFGF